MRRSLFVMPALAVALVGAAGCQADVANQAASTSAISAQPAAPASSLTPVSQSAPTSVVPTRFTGLEGCNEGRVVSQQDKSSHTSQTYRCTTLNGAQYWLLFSDPNAPTPAPTSAASPKPAPTTAPPVPVNPPTAGSGVEYEQAAPSGTPQAEANGAGSAPTASEPPPTATSAR